MSWTWEEAQTAMDAAAGRQSESEDAIRDLAEDAAQKERDYNVALHVRGVALRLDGIAATAWEGIAKREPDIAEMRYSWNVAEGRLAAARAASYRCRDDRADTLQLARWSQAREMADGSIGGDSRLSFTNRREVA